MLVGVASLPPEYRLFTVETGKTAYTFATQCTQKLFQPIVLNFMGLEHHQ